MAKRTRKSMAAGNASGLVSDEVVTPEVPLKPLAGYLRLTVDREGNKIGYEVQQEAIERWANAYGYTIGEWYKDENLTAANRKVKRPDYERMLVDVADGKWGGIVVWRIDRLVRLTAEFERCNEIVENANAFIVSIDPPFDTRNEFGKFVMRLLVMLAEMEIAAMRARSLGHHRAKAIAGKHKGGGSRAFGFVGPEYDEHGNLLNRGVHGVKHVDSEVEACREAARRVAWEGETYADVIRDWSTRDPPILGTNGAIFETTALTDILTNPRMIGLRAHTTIDPKTKQPITNVYPAEWEPILDRETFERLEALRAVRTPGRPFEFNLTGGIAVCGRCGKRMVGTRVTTGAGKTARKVPGYRCEATVTARLKGACGKGTVIADHVDKQVIARIATRLVESTEELKAITDNSDLNDDVSRALSTIEECDAQLEQIRIMSGISSTEGGLAMSDVPGFRAPWVRKREEAVNDLNRARATLRVPHPIGADLDDLWEWFTNLTVSQRRSFVRAHVRDVIVMPAEKRGFFDPSRVRVAFADAKKSDARG